MLVCRHCGWENPNEAAFCTNCGRGLARGRNAGVGDKPSQRFRALGSPVVTVQTTDPPEPADPPLPKLSPPPSVEGAPTLLDFRMPDQMLAELARVRKVRGRTAPPQRVTPPVRRDLRVSEGPDGPSARATLEDIPGRPSKPMALGEIARALRAEAGSSKPPHAPEPPEVLELADAFEVADASVPPEALEPPAEEGEARRTIRLEPPQEFDDDEAPGAEPLEDADPPPEVEPFEGAVDTPPLDGALEAAAEPDAEPYRPTAHDLVAVPAVLGIPEVALRQTEEDLPFVVAPTIDRDAVDESVDLLPEDLLEDADDSMSGLEVEPDTFTDFLSDGPPVPAGESPDLLEDVEEILEEVDEEPDEPEDVLASDEYEAVSVRDGGARPALPPAGPPPIPVASAARFVLRPLTENLDADRLLPIAEEPLVVGREEGGLRLGDDPHASPLHARFVLEDDTLEVVDLDSFNGVWLRVRGDVVLQAGALFFAGQHLFRLDSVEPVASSRADDGTVRLGAPPSRSGFQVAVLDADGNVSHVHRLAPDGCRIGRHIADLVFTYDTFMSGTHALLRPRDGEVLLRDLSSRNGTWIRIDGRAALTIGDAVMIGRTVLRVGEPVG